LIALSLATARCGGSAFTSDPVGSSPDAYAPGDAADDKDGGLPEEASVADATVGPDATADAGSDEGGGRPEDGGRRDAFVDDAFVDDAESSGDATSTDAEAGDAGSKDAGGAARDAGPTDAGGIDAGATDAGESDAASCAIPCATKCCGSGEQCCTTLQIELDGGSLATRSCMAVSGVACIVGLTSDSN
jgi:hypothetical protein